MHRGLFLFGEVGGSKRSFQVGGGACFKPGHQSGVRVHLLVDDVLGLLCGRGPFLTVLHQVNSDKQANAPEEGKERKLDRCSTRRCIVIQY